MPESTLPQFTLHRLCLTAAAITWLSTWFLACTAAAQPSARPAVWLYSLVAVDHGGERLLPHWLAWYHQLGVPYSQFVLDLLHETGRGRAGLQQAQRVLAKRSITPRLLEAHYTPALQDRAALSALTRFLAAPEDWLIVADSDEFIEFGGGATPLPALVARMAAEGATYQRAEMLDRVAPRGALPHVQAQPSIWEQFPLTCPLVGGLSAGNPLKITLFRAFLRVGPGHHFIVDPAGAYAHFSSAGWYPQQCQLGSPTCSSTAAGARSPAAASELFLQTPYARYPERYAPAGRWAAREFRLWGRVHHFKWHRSVVANLAARAARDSGDCRLGVNEDSCTPRFKYWREVARQYAAVADTGRLDVARWNCTRPPPGAFHSFLRGDHS